MSRLSHTLFWGTVLILVLVVAAITIVVFSRRYRAYLTRGDHKPTPAEDVWSMHRLPPDEEPYSDRPPDERRGDTPDDHTPFGPDKSPPDEPSLG
jgi:hypothetical protein